MIENILSYLPNKLSLEISKYSHNEYLNEIRIRAGKRVMLIYGNYEVKLEYSASLKDILDILIKVSENSIYSIQNEINSGFVTLKGGHRVGICGEVVLSEGKIKNIKNINGMNIRIAKQVKGCADKIMPYIIEDGRLKNTLIISPPRLWKNNNVKRHYKAT